MNLVTKPLTRAQKLGSWLVVVIFVGLTFLLIKEPAGPRIGDSLGGEISKLRTQLSDLTTKQLAAKTANINADTTSLDKQIEELRNRLAPLEQKEEEERARDAAATKARRDEEELKKFQEDLLALQKKCEPLKQKRISDLTINDVELLNRCGISIPKLPVQ